MSHLWQHPFVNVFKHFNVQSWRKTSKEGEVTSLMDKTLKCTVYKIVGSIPAGNYIQLPKTTSQSLGLTGRFMYLLFKPIPSKYFVVHVDVATEDGLIVRISFSNLFKEFKSTSTWLQFPFVCHAAKGTLSAHTGATSKNHSGPAPLSTRWTMLCLDYQYILSMYLNRKYSYLKNIRLCANMMVKNIFTSDMDYEPGVTFDQVKKTGMTLQGIAPAPREMSFPVPKGESWRDHYDLIKFPSSGSKTPFDSIQYTTSSPHTSKTAPPGVASPKRVEPKTVIAGSATGEKMNWVDQLSKPKKGVKRREVVKELPAVGLDEKVDISIEQTPDGEVHVYAHPDEELLVHRQDTQTGKITTSRVAAPTLLPAKKDSHKSLQPDPILQLRRIVGFGGCSTSDALWTKSGTSLVYPCNAVVVAMQVSNGHQRFFIGHTDKVACIALNGNSSLLASGQTGTQSVVRVWKFQTKECLAMCKTHVHSLKCLSMSHNGNVLCGVGKDGHGKNMVVIWNTERVSKGGQVTVIAKAHTDVDIVRMRIASFDDTRMVSCGRDNIRLWRVKEGSLRSAPVNLGEYHCMEFTECCFEAGYEASRDPLDRLVYACTRSGHIFEVDYRKVSIQQVRRLLPVKPQSKEKQTFNSGAGIAINSLCVNEAFCVTGSDDGYLRLWPLDFKHVYLEAEHEGPVTAVDISADGVKILAGTSTGNLGILDVATRGHTTVMRSHTQKILSMSLDPIRRHMATVSEDHTIRVWDLDTMQQLYDFTAPKECPCAICYHPSQQVFACGFESGAVRMFSVAATSMLAEHKQHRGKVIGLVFSPNGSYLYSAGSLGSLALYEATENQYQLLRLLGNTLTRGETQGPEALAVSPDSRFLAFVGPTSFTISVVDGRSLDEVLRIDITSLNPADNTRTAIDTAVRVKYAPANVKQLLVTTSSKKLLKFDARTGRILAEIDNIHRSGCTAIDVSEDGRHLATAGDKVLKIWDYHMRLDINFQVFIGHSENITKAVFTPDSLGLISIGEAIFMWDFLANARERPKLEGRTTAKNYFTGKEEEYVPYKSPIRQSLGGSSSSPRQKAPHPISYEPGTQVANISAIERSHNEDLLGEDIISETMSEKEEPLIGAQFQEKLHIADTQSGVELVADEPYENGSVGEEDLQEELQQQRTPVKQVAAAGSTPIKTGKTDHPAPTVLKHFTQRHKTHSLAQRRYTAPPNQAGLKLKYVIGYNGNGRGNMVWYPDSGIFAYTSGCTVIVEDLNAGSQQHLQGHSEEISTLAIQNDCQVLASASGSFGLSQSQICLWDLQQMVCKKVLTHHEFDIVCLAYSRDDRFLISVGDYRECSIVVWCTYNLCILTTTKTSVPVHDLRWDPYTVNEFASVGAEGSVFFWLLDETGSTCSLNVHEAEVPDDLLQTHHMGVEEIGFTCLEYAGDSILYIGTSNGTVSAWDTRLNSCFMHWQADTEEIDVLFSHNGRLVTGSGSRSLRLWSVIGMGELKLPGEHNNMRQGGLTMEDEMNLDGAITCAVFDETMDIVAACYTDLQLYEFINPAMPDLEGFSQVRYSDKKAPGNASKCTLQAADIKQFPGVSPRLPTSIGKIYQGIVGTSAGSLWYINWPERGSIRLVSGHVTKINAVGFADDQYFATCADDGGLRVWSVSDKEQTIQFQVADQACNCMAFAPPSVTSCVNTVSNLDSAAVVAHTKRDDPVQLPHIVAGYSDGTVRMFDLNRFEMVLKMHPHAVAVTAIAFSSDGRMVITGASDGVIAISSPTTGMTVRVINDHKGAPITCLDVTCSRDRESTISAPELWLACSADRRVSVWSADWSKDMCELIDWLSFPAPAFTPDGGVIKKGDQSYYQQVPPSLAQFSYEEPDIVVYTGYGMQKHISCYSLSQRKVVRSIALTHWAVSLDQCSCAPIMSVGNNERLLKLVDYYEGSFQDFTGHNDSLGLVKFSPDGKLLLSTSHNEMIVWEVSV